MVIRASGRDSFSALSDLLVVLTYCQRSQLRQPVRVLYRPLDACAYLRMLSQFPADVGFFLCAGGFVCGAVPGAADEFSQG